MTVSELMSYYEMETGASIGVEALHRAFFMEGPLKLTPGQYLHHGDFCRYIKLNGDFRVCCKHKESTIRRASATRRPFRSVCPFGVCDYCAPVFLRSGEMVCVLYLGQCRTRSVLPEIPGKPYRGAELPEYTPLLAEKLKAAAQVISALIAAELEQMRRTGVSLPEAKRDRAFYVDSVRRFIDANYTKNIGLAEAAEHLCLTPNHLGELLRAATNRSFRQILTERRIREAKVYLRLHHSRSIGEIAFLCGFPDSNYFATVFRRSEGISPTEYRKGSD